MLKQLSELLRVRCGTQRERLEAGEVHLVGRQYMGIKIGWGMWYGNLQKFSDSFYFLSKIGKKDFS